MITNQPNDYRAFVRQLCKPGAEIRSELTPTDCHRLHMAIGVSGEAGELLDAIKKAVIYRRPLDVDNVREEAGDILFYLTGLLDSVSVDLQDVIAENMDKLRLRYTAHSYSNKAAIDRADKREGAINTMDKGHGAEVKAEPDDDFNEIIPRQCSIDDPECESCQ